MESIQCIDLRIGNLVTVDNPKYHLSVKDKILMVVGIEDWRDKSSIALMHIDSKENYIIPALSQWIEFVKPIPLDEEWLMKLGFKAIDNKTYINGKEWIMQISDDYVDDLSLINRDGTWFDGIGTHSYTENGAMSVSTLCRGNYVCNNIGTVHELQNTFYILSGGKQLTIKKDE